MERFLLELEFVAEVAGEGACDCDGNVLDECGVCGGDQSFNEIINCNPACDIGTDVNTPLEYSFEATGELSDIEINLASFALGGTGETWAGDLLLSVASPSGDCIEIGGYNQTLACDSIGDFPETWDVTEITNPLSFSLNVSAAGLSGSGTWVISIINGYASGNDNDIWEWMESLLFRPHVKYLDVQMLLPLTMMLQLPQMIVHV